MKQEITDFFKSKGLSVEKIDQVDPHKSGRLRIESAMVEVYKRRNELKDILLARTVWEIAHETKLEFIEERFEEDYIVNLKKKIIVYQEAALVGWILAGAIGIFSLIAYLHRSGVI